MKHLLFCFLFFLPFAMIAQEEEEEENEKPEKPWKKDTSFHKSRLAIKTNLFQQIQFTAADIAVCVPLSRNLYANVDIVGATNKFFPGKMPRTFPSIAVIGELRYFFPQHSTFDGGFVGSYYRYKRGVKTIKRYEPVIYDDAYDIYSHTIGAIVGMSFQPRRFPHLVIEVHTGMGLAVELDIIRKNPTLPSLAYDPHRSSLEINEGLNPRAGFCVGYAF